MSFKGGAFRTIVGGLALVGAVTLLVFCVRAAVSYRRSFGPPSDVFVNNPLFSPDGRFKMIQYASSGGGGISSYCNETYSIVPVATPIAAAWEDNNIVATMPCAGIGGIHHGASWIGDHRLHIVLNLTQALQDGYVKLKPHDATGVAFVEYETHD